MTLADIYSYSPMNQFVVYFFLVLVTLTHALPIEYRCKTKGVLRLRYGRIIVKDPSYSDGSKLLFKCKKYYDLIGPDEIICHKGRWSSRRLPRCKALACPNPGSPENSFRIGSDFRIGRSVRFICQSGFKVIGSPVRTCLQNKQWSGRVAVCDDRSSDCPTLGTPVSGIKIGNRYNIGSTVRFICKQGYILQGSSVRLCMRNGKWNGTEPKCIEQFQYYVRGVDETATLLRKRLDMMLQYTCSGINSTCSTTGLESRARTIDLGIGGGLDVLFILDASTSIRKKEFKLGIKFAEKIVQQLGATWRSKGTRIAAIVFATKPELVFSFGDHGATTKTGVIKKLRRIPKLGGATAMRYALEMAKTRVFVTNKSKRQRVCFIITDGRFNIGGSPEKVAKILRQRYGVTITAIGVGKKVSVRELYSIATERKDDVIVVKSYKDLVRSMNKAVKIDYSQCGESSYDPRGRIVGGNKAHPGRWPWQIGIHKMDFDGRLRVFCAGALIDKRWVLTTAHCVYKSTIPELYTIKAGDHNLMIQDPMEQELLAEMIFIHPDYRGSPLYENDIALVKLSRDTRLGPFVRPVCLPKTSEDLLEPGNLGFVAGWGTTQVLLPGQPPSRSHRNSKVLRQSAFAVQTNALCDEKTDYYFNSTVMFCAGDGKGGNDTCKGDNGGSFVRLVPRNGTHRWVSAGLVSWGEGCGLKDKYAYYTRVAPFVEWIQKTIRDNR